MSWDLPGACGLRRDIIWQKRGALPREPVQQRLGEGLHNLPVAADVHHGDRPDGRGAVRMPAWLPAGRGRVHGVRAGQVQDLGRNLPVPEFLL